MEPSLRQLNPEQQRRRLRLLAARAQAKAARARLTSRRAPGDVRIRDLVALRRRHTE